MIATKRHKKHQRHKKHKGHNRFYSFATASSFCAFGAFCASLWLTSAANAQTNDYLDLETPAFKLKLSKASQTLAALEPKNASGFDFTPADRLSQRATDRYHHLGDLILRARVGPAPWRRYDTADLRKPVEPLSAVAPTLAKADLAPTLPDDIPLQITRWWIVENGQLILRFELRNKTAQPVQIGALGIPMVFNNIITVMLGMRSSSPSMARRTSLP